MPQHDYNVPSAQTQEIKPKFEKHEDINLPVFTKEIPLRTIVKKHGQNVIIEYEWNMLGGECIKINTMKFRDDNNLERIHKINITDGAEVGSFKIAQTTYIIRKTSEEIANELMKTSEKIKESILGVIGYFKTIKGNVYTVSKIDGDGWTLDKRLGLRNFSLSEIDKAGKKKFADFIIEEMLKLYKQGYGLKNFNLLDIIITRKKIVFGNLSAIVKLSAAKTVENFIANLKIMIKSGVAQKSDVVYGIIFSFGIMKKEYSEWSKETGNEGKTEIEVLENMEKSVLK